MVSLFHVALPPYLDAQRPEPARGQTADIEVAADRGVLEVGVDGGGTPGSGLVTTAPAGAAPSGGWSPPSNSLLRHLRRHRSG